MIQISDTLTISATRLLDLAREVTLQLGEWQYHKHLVVHLSHSGRPTVYFTLADDADDTTRADFIDAVSTALDKPIRSLPCQSGGVLMSVSSSGYDLTRVVVSASVTVGGAR